MGVSVGDKCYMSVTFINAVVFQPVPVVQAAASQVSYQLAGVSGMETQQ